MTDAYVNRQALDDWNLANQRAILEYRISQGHQDLPGGLNYRQGRVLARPVREWFLDALAAFELAKAQVAATKALADMALRELGAALNEIERLKGGQGQAQEAQATRTRVLSRVS